MKDRRHTPPGQQQDSRSPEPSRPDFGSNADAGQWLGTGTGDEESSLLLDEGPGGSLGGPGGSLGGPGEGAPRAELDYNPTVEADGALRDPEQRDGVLPYNADGSWRHAEILANLAQIDNDPITEVDSMRCSAVAFLGMQIAGGPSGVAAVAAEVQAQVRQLLDAGAWPVLDDVRQAFESRRLGYLRTLRPLLPAIAARIRGRAGTYQDLRVLSAAIYATRDSDEGANGLSPGERGGLSTLTPEADRVVNEVRRGWAGAQQLFTELEATPGQAALVGVSLTGARVDHNLTIGHDGSIYVFDPLPRRGSQLMRLSSDERDIRDYFERDGQPLNWELDRFVAPDRAPGGRAPT